MLNTHAYIRAPVIFISVSVLLRSNAILQIRNTGVRIASDRWTIEACTNIAHATRGRKCTRIHDRIACQARIPLTCGLSERNFRQSAPMGDIRYCLRYSNYRVPHHSLGGSPDLAAASMFELLIIVQYCAEIDYLFSAVELD